MRPRMDLPCDNAAPALLEAGLIGPINAGDVAGRKLAAGQSRVAEERERIARDLHDVVIQRLFALGLGLDALSARLEGDAADQVAHATDELNHTIRDIRVAIFSL